MAELLAFPIPVDAETAVWAGPMFVGMAFTGVAVLIWQAVRYFRDNRDNRDNDEHSADSL